MTIAEKLQTIAENEQRVYEAGKANGRISFMEDFQQHGERTNYLSAFSGFYDNVYDPIYPIKGDVRQVFQYSKVTDTKVDIDATIGDRLFYAFNSSSVVTVRKLIVSENTMYDYTFRYAEALVNITFEGTIGQNIDVSNSPLSHDSLINISEHLKDMTGTGETRQIVLGQKNRPKLTDAEKAEIQAKGWTIT
jgi:hypothetical protein